MRKTTKSSAAFSHTVHTFSFFFRVAGDGDGLGFLLVLFSSVVSYSYGERIAQKQIDPWVRCLDWVFFTHT